MPLFLILLLSSTALSEAINGLAYTKNNDREIEISSYNVHQEDWIEVPKYWFFRRHSVLATLQSLSSDFINLQELHSNRLPELTEALPRYQAIKEDGGLAILYRRDRWLVFSVDRFSSSEGIYGMRSRFISRIDPQNGPIEIWNIWIHPKKWTEQTLPASLQFLLSDSPSKPDLISISMKGPDQLSHNKLMWNKTAEGSGLRQADPQTFALTTNGWWATKWTTRDWHDAILVREDWQLEGSQLIRQKHRGSYPSTHFPMITKYRRKSEHLISEGLTKLEDPGSAR